MPALSFKPEWVNALLSGEKRQTTRKPAPAGKPPRIEEGDLCQVYNSQRVKINSKPLYPTTVKGRERILTKMIDGKYPQLPGMDILLPPRYSDIKEYYAHFLGVVEISEVYLIVPSEMSGEDLEAWAWSDGFFSLDTGDTWFVHHHSETWMDQEWVVCRWNGWNERYFKAI